MGLIKSKMASLALVVVSLTALHAQRPTSTTTTQSDRHPNSQATPPTNEPTSPSNRPSSKPKPETYKPAVDDDFDVVYAKDAAAKASVVEGQAAMLKERYDLSDSASEVMMSGGRKAVQGGVRVKLKQGVTWSKLTELTPEEIYEADLFPAGFRPLPHVKHTTGGQVFPKLQIDKIREIEQRDLSRFDVDFDLPDHLMPEFPPPLFLTTHPGEDVSGGEVLTIKNYFRLLKGKVTPVQMEGMRLLLTPFPQQEFNQTDAWRISQAC